MNWQKMVLKAKYQGPSKEYAGSTYASTKLFLKRMNTHIEDLTKIAKEHRPELQAIDAMLPWYIESLQSLIDEVDENIIEQAKYGGNNPELFDRDKRKDFKAWKHGAKYRSDEGEEI